MILLRPVVMTLGLLLAVGCSQGPYDYEGDYGIFENECVAPDNPNLNKFLTISRVAGRDEPTYYAENYFAESLRSQSLNPEEQLGLAHMPSSSKETTPSEDGSLTFVFLKKGTANFLTQTSTVEVVMTVHPGGRNLRATQWAITLKDPTNDTVIESDEFFSEGSSGCLVRLLTDEELAKGEKRRARRVARIAKDVAGKWEGTYICGQGVTGLTLDVTTEASSMSAVFNFYPRPENPTVKSGSFSLSGTLSSEGAFKLEPTAWIKRPAGYNMVGMSGRIDDDRTELSGSLASGSCSGFQLYKK